MRTLPKDLDDEDLVILVRSKDKHLYEEVVKRYQRKLFRYALSLIGDEEDAMDTVQNSFINAYINLNSFDPKQSFSSWIYRIVHNDALNFLKKRKRLVFLTEEKWQMIPEKDNSDPADLLQRKTVKRQLNQILKEMDLKYSEPLILFYIESFSYQEISQILHIPIQTVGTRINRGKKQLAVICKKKGITNL